MRRAANIRWIAFDAVGTLIAAEPSVASVYHRIGRQYGSALSLPEVEQRFAKVFGKRAAAGDLVSNAAIEREFWRTVVTEVFDDLRDSTGCYEELHAWFASPEAWRCFDDAGPALEMLAQCGYRLALASNFDERLHPVRDGLPSLRRIETCVVSSEVGWRKPHGEFFAALVDRCGCRPEQILMVGDDPLGDVGGAEQAGLRAVLLDRSQHNAGQMAEPTTIHSLLELNDLLTAGD